MKLKYYLRGLGIGIALTAVILHFSVYNSNSTLTDEEIMERASRLGMVPRVTLSENESIINEGENPAPDIEEGTVMPGESEDPGDGQNPGNQDGMAGPDDAGRDPSEDDSSGENTDDISDENLSGENTDDTSSVNPAEEDYVPANGQNEDNGTVVLDEQSEGMGGNGEMGDSIIITVTGGDSSVSVAAKLAQAGLVSSAAAYDAFLCDNGYDKRISTGTHVIPIGASEREIAEILITRQ